MTKGITTNGRIPTSRIMFRARRPSFRPSRAREHFFRLYLPVIIGPPRIANAHRAPNAEILLCSHFRLHFSEPLDSLNKTHYAFDPTLRRARSFFFCSLRCRAAGFAKLTLPPETPAVLTNLFLRHHQSCGSREAHGTSKHPIIIWLPLEAEALWWRIWWPPDSNME